MSRQVGLQEKRWRRAAALLAAFGVAVLGMSPAAQADAAKVEPEEVPPGTITTVAGGLGEGARATETSIGQPAYLAVDGSDNLYFASKMEGLPSVRKVDAAIGTVSVVAGAGFGVGYIGTAGKISATVGPPWSGDGGPATDAILGNEPVGVAFDRFGHVYLTDYSNGLVRRVDAETKIITTIAGDGPNWDGLHSGRPECEAHRQPGPLPEDGGSATESCLLWPGSVAVDKFGNVYFVEEAGARVRRVDARTGVITTVAGGGQSGSCGVDGIPATEACLSKPAGLELDRAGDLLIAELDRVRRIDATTGIIMTVAQGLNRPSDVALDPAGNIIVTESGAHRVVRVDAATGAVTTVAGIGVPAARQSFPNSDPPAEPQGDGGPATLAPLYQPGGLAVDSLGRIYFAEGPWRHLIRRVDTNGVISTAAGNGKIRWSGDGGPAIQAQLNQVVDGAVDAAGNLFIADQGNMRIRKIEASTGTITTVAGKFFRRVIGSDPGFRAAWALDGVPATEAVIFPQDVAVDAAGNLYIVDALQSGDGVVQARIRRVDAETQIITTVVGKFVNNDGCAVVVDGVPALGAGLCRPVDMDVDARGNLFIADAGTCRVRRVDADSGIITTVAGETCTGTHIRDQTWHEPHAVVMDSTGTLFFAEDEFVAGATGRGDLVSSRIRKVDPTGLITTVAGEGDERDRLNDWTRYCGDGRPAIQTCLYGVRGLAVDPAGNLFVSDKYNYRVHKIDAQTQIITTVAGIGLWGPQGEGGPARRSRLAAPVGVMVGPAGDLYVVDSDISEFNAGMPNPDRIRKITGVAERPSGRRANEK